MLYSVLLSSKIKEALENNNWCSFDDVTDRIIGVFRASVASNLLNDGFTAVQVAEWLGHSSSTTTLKFYAHIDKTSKMAIANSLAPV